MHLLSFRTKGFRDPDAIRHENVNDLEGHVLARTLQGALRDGGWSTGEIEVEDRGWAFSAATKGGRWRVAAALEPQDENPDDPDARAPDGAWMTGCVGIVRLRTTLDRLTGRARQTEADRVSGALFDALDDMTGVVDLTRETV